MADMRQKINLGARGAGALWNGKSCKWQATPNWIQAKMAIAQVLIPLSPLGSEAT
jgi:hypothetical protein